MTLITLGLYVAETGCSAALAKGSAKRSSLLARGESCLTANAAAQTGCLGGPGWFADDGKTSVCIGSCFRRNLWGEEAESKTCCPASGKGCAETARAIVFVLTEG